MTDVRPQTDLKILFVILGVLGILLVATTIRGAFIIDEINYVVNVSALRDGRVTVPGTEGLSPSKELLYFDPEPYNRVVSATPVASLAPPLYAPIALPFVALGWRGLALLNTLSFVIAALLVFLFVRHHTTERTSAWLAVALFVLAGYSTEYAQGVWPHMLSVLLCVAAVYCVSHVWFAKTSLFPLLGGFLIGVASGVREQNIFLAACLGLTILIWAIQRMKSAAMYLSGLSIPLLASATINYYRLGVFYPTPKVSAYAHFVANPVRSGVWLKPFEVFLVKIVDFSTFAWFQNPSEFVDYAREPASGAFLVGGIVKKALIQSSPWIALALVLAVAIWFRPRFVGDRQKKLIQALSVLILPTIGMFAMAGFRMDGLSFNQRYLLEMVPVAAMIVALSVDGLFVSQTHILTASLVAAFCFSVILAFFSPTTRHISISDVPLVLGSLLVIAWLIRNTGKLRLWLGITLGLCIGWSFMVQNIDLMTSRKIRTTNAEGLDSLNSKIPDHAALFTFWGAQKATAGPLQLKKDVVILDAWADDGKDASTLTQELLHQHRDIFVDGTGMPPAIMQSIQGEDSLASVLTRPFVLYRLVKRKDRLDPPPSWKSGNGGHDKPPN